jgi:hypothetical protein
MVSGLLAAVSGLEAALPSRWDALKALASIPRRGRTPGSNARCLSISSLRCSPGRLPGSRTELPWGGAASLAALLSRTTDGNTEPSGGWALAASGCLVRDEQFAPCHAAAARSQILRACHPPTRMSKYQHMKPSAILHDEQGYCLSHRTFLPRHISHDLRLRPRFGGGVFFYLAWKWSAESAG